MGTLKRKPEWLKFTIPGGSEFVRVNRLIRERGLHTVCVEAGCPNMGECFGMGTATFLILGDVCTRNCAYCGIAKGSPQPPDVDEPRKVAEAVKLMGLKYSVITSVTRDDLADRGAGQFARTVLQIKESCPGTGIELLVPDFKGRMESSLDEISETGPDVINHNIEVVRSRFGKLRPLGDYDLSLSLIAAAASRGFEAKSGLMVGFGETLEEIYSTLRDLRDAGCVSLTVGQYLTPDRNSCPVERYYSPDEFDVIAEYARSIGFQRVMSGPLVRSSYHAADR